MYRAFADVNQVSGTCFNNRRYDYILQIKYIDHLEAHTKYKNSKLVEQRQVPIYRKQLNGWILWFQYLGGIS